MKAVRSLEPLALPARPRLCPPRPAPLRSPAAPTLPSAPPLFPAAAGWAPQKPCAAASLFGTWPSFNSQHTQRIQLEFRAAVRLPGGLLLGGVGVD